MKRRYYTADIPADAYETEDDGFNLAILNVKERMRIYYMVANWRLIWIKGDEIRICMDTVD
jgi:hypothetical protein